MNQMSNSKLQIPNKSQAPIPNDPKRFCLEFGISTIWNLFVIWRLEFGA